MVGSLKSNHNTRRWVYLAISGACCLLSVVVVLVVITKPGPEPDVRDLAGQSSRPATAVQHRPAAQPSTLPPPREVSVWDDSPRQPSVPARTFAALTPSGPPPQTGPSMAISGYPGRILEELLDINLTRLTLAQAEEVNRQLDQLRSMSLAAMPAIGEFLARQQDINFDAIEGGTAVQYPSLRIALLDVLVGMGTPEAVTMIADSLQNVADPLEIALVAGRRTDAACHRGPGRRRDPGPAPGARSATIQLLRDHDARQPPQRSRHSGPG